MATIYDIAKITSGDPLEKAGMRAEEASAISAQIKHQKDIIKQINEAIAAAEAKAKKNKFGFGLGGGILGGLLGGGLSLLTGGTAPLLMGVLGAGAGAGAAEKIRQGEWLSEVTGREEVTKELQEAQQKFSGRKQAKDIERTTETFEEALDEMVMADITNSMLSALIFPGATKTESVVPSTADAGDLLTTDLTVDLSANASQTVPAAGVAGPSSNIVPFQGAPQDMALRTSPSTYGLSQVAPVNPIAQTVTETVAPSLDYFNAVLNPFDDIAADSILGKIATNPITQAAGRTLYTPIMGELSYPEIVVDDYVEPRFINPYRRR